MNTPTKPLTAKQAKVLSALVAHCDEHMSDIAYPGEIAGLSKGMRDRLEARGLIRSIGHEQFDGTPEDRKVVVTVTDEGYSAAAEVSS